MPQSTPWQAGPVGGAVTPAQAEAASDLVVPRRFRGPNSSGNGGWSAGALAALLDPSHGSAVTVTLRRPPPLETPMEVTAVDSALVASHGGAAVLEATSALSEPQRVLPVSAEEARAAEGTYRGFDHHAFPECFSCGTAREAADGLRIFPGRVSDQEGLVRVAATCTPHESLHEDWHDYAGSDRRASLPVTWAALDCVGAWTVDMVGRPIVLGRMTARVSSLPVVGESHVVVGLLRSVDGRKHQTAGSIYDSRGALVGVAEHVWITIDPEAFS